jgi:sugar fermentation stimulation protein A
MTKPSPFYRLDPVTGGVRFAALLPARLVGRPNRFLVIARRAGRLVHAASRDPGRLETLLVPGAELRLAHTPGPKRRTRHTLVLVRAGRAWACLVPALANQLLEAAIATRRAAGLEGARVHAREVAHGRSRLDLLLVERGRRVLTEVKSCTFVSRGTAMFPDAPTARGLRHVRELMAHRRRGGRALIVFVVQRGDARRLRPFAERDPELANALRAAARSGVRILAYACRVGVLGARLDRRIAVML